MARYGTGRRSREALGRALPLVPLLVGAALLIAAEPMTLRVVRVGGRTVDTVSAGAHHGWALAVLAVAAVALGAMPARAARVAAVVVAGVAVWIVLGVDRPALDDAGLVGGRLGLGVAGPAWRVELVGAILAAVGAIAGAAAVRR